MKNDVQMEYFHLPQGVELALERLHVYGYEAYVAGGCVRDFLRGVEPHDYDITTSALPEEVMAVFEDFRIIETGLQHGTVTVLVDGMPLEITTYRVDGDYSDGRRPDSVAFTRSLSEDLRRRDFTINAMVYNLQDGLVDLFNGREDLKRGIVRCVGKPDERFREDGLRILRGLRFASVLGFDLEQETAESAIKNRAILQNISKERIQVELTKLLMGKRPSQIILNHFQVIGEVLPELAALKGFEQMNPHHLYDVLSHSCFAVDAIEPVAYLRWAALLHDIGKPSCFQADKNGVGHFFGHEAAGERLALDVMKRLKMDNQTIEKISVLIRYHDSGIGENTRSVKRWLNRIGEENFYDLLKLKDADAKSRGTEHDKSLAHTETLGEIADGVIAEKQCFTLKGLAVNGNDILNCGITEGKMIGKILSLLLQNVIEERVENDRAVLLALVEHVKKEMDETNREF